MAQLPQSNLNGLPSITAEEMQRNDPAKLNRILQLLGSQLQSVQTGNPSSVGITNQTIVQNIVSGGGTSSSSGGTSSSTVTLQGTHAQRLSTFLPTAQQAGTYYYETDRTSTYLDFLTPALDKVWQWVSGTMFSAFASIPGDLTTNDAGFLFYATDLDLIYRWSGTAWALYNIVEPILQDTHANRLANYPSVTYALSTLFFETDRTSFYIVQNATGTVTVTGGTTVTWVSGHHFTNSTPGFTAAQWPAGTPIVINGVTTTVASVASATSLTVQTAVANGVGVAYSVASGRWAFTSGAYLAAYASKPTDIGENDANFLFEDNVTYFRSWTWGGAAWSYTIGQPPFLAIQMTMVNSADNGWHLADGSAGVTVTKSDATTTTATFPNLQGGYYPKGGTYTGSPVATLDPVIAQITPAGSISAAGTFSGSPSGSVTVQSGAGASVAPPFTPSGSVSVTATFSGTPVTPVVSVSGEPEHITVAYYVKL